jgi:large subunit ribosomal protein L21
VSFDQVLLVSNDNGDVTAGSPFVSGAKVLGVVGELEKGKKVRVFKKKRRKQYRRTKGHRSQLTRVRITDIQV